MTTIPSSSELPGPSTDAEYEVAVVGGGVGGLTASMALAPSLRSVIVIDGTVVKARTPEQPENIATAATASNHNGAAPTPAVDGSENSTASTPADPRFELETSTGTLIRARRLIIATGLSDELPDIPGLAEGWGETVLHCPHTAAGRLNRRCPQHTRRRRSESEPLLPRERGSVRTVGRQRHRPPERNGLDHPDRDGWPDDDPPASGRSATAPTCRRWWSPAPPAASSPVPTSTPTSSSIR